VKIWVLVNPRAGSGRSVASGRAFVHHVPHAELVATRTADDAVNIARQAVNEGVDVIVAVGGDGTLQQCVSGLCLNESGVARPSPTAMLILPAGTGGDYRRSFSMTESIDHALTRLDQPKKLLVDVGHLKYQAGQERHSAAFINVVSFGLGGLTDRLVETSPKWLGGKATYLLGALRATLVHQPIAVELWIDDQLVETAPFSNVAICLGQYFGGGMKIAPHADPSDGMLDIITMELSKWRTVSLAGSIYQGTHLTQEGVKCYRGKKVEARAVRARECLVDADGESMGSLPLEVELIPGALTLLT
jgi:diacylglycerol kinase (ATP)